MDKKSPIPPNWGFNELQIDPDLLKTGRLGLLRATGLFSDGTPFQLTEADGLPAPLELDSELSGQFVCLARSPQSREQLVVERAVPLGVVNIPLSRVAAVRPYLGIVLDEHFIPPVLRFAASPVLTSFAQELHGLLHQRGIALAGRVSAAGGGGATETAMLQAINRYEPEAKRLVTDGSMHPNDLYLFCVAVASELATITRSSRRLDPFYRHDRLRETFVPVIAALRSALSSVLAQSVIAIPIEPKKFGLSLARVADRSLYGTAAFVLAVRSDMPSEELRKRFPAQLKVGPVEKIRDLVNLQLPGIALQAIPKAPRQFPHRAGTQYFAMDQSSELWGELKGSAGIALHVGGEIPGLKMEFWAQRESQALVAGLIPDDYDPFGEPPPAPMAAARAFAAKPIGRSEQAKSSEWLSPMSQHYRTPPTPKAAPMLEPAASRIQMTVFGPSQVRRRKPFFLQTIFHLVGADEKALALARIVEPQSTIAQALPIAVKVRDGEIITVRLLADSRVSVDESTQTLQWRGDTLAAQFSIELPWMDWRSEYLFTVEVDVAGCPVGRCKFRVGVNRSQTESVSRHAYGSMSRYQRVFLSYASEDAAVVADLAQLIEIQGMEYFLDKLSLRSGSEWRPELEKHIQSSDLFLLCWSRHAARSEWVAKEIEWALRTQRDTDGLRPDIRPFVLDGPPIARPPRALRHLHFNSATRFLKQSVLRPTESP